MALKRRACDHFSRDAEPSIHILQNGLLSQRDTLKWLYTHFKQSKFIESPHFLNYFNNCLCCFQM